MVHTLPYKYMECIIYSNIYLFRIPDLIRSDIIPPGHNRLKTKSPQDIISSHEEYKKFQISFYQFILVTFIIFPTIKTLSASITKITLFKYIFIEMNLLLFISYVQ